MHSNIASSVSVSVNKPALYLPVSFLPPDGCPDLCNGNGRCTLGQNSWQCVCQTGWRGPGCNVAMETSCADNKDNEGGEQKSSNSPSLKTRGLSIFLHESFYFRKSLAVIIIKCCCFPPLKQTGLSALALQSAPLLEFHCSPWRFRGAEYRPLGRNFFLQAPGTRALQNSLLCLCAQA